MGLRDASRGSFVDGAAVFDADHGDEQLAAGGAERLTRIADFVATCTASGSDLP
jgi:hypothetical protein